MPNPLISIITPVYNPGNFISETLESIYNQTYQKWECLVIDDGSTDNSMQIARDWAKKDSRFKIFEKGHTGVAATRNLGLENAEGELIMFLDADDIVLLERLETAVYDFERDYFLDVSFSDYCYVENEEYKRHRYTIDDSILNGKSILSEWDFNVTFPMHCVVFKKSLIDNFLFNTDLQAKVDWDLWVHLFMKNPKVKNNSKIQNYYRIHNNVITRNPKRMRKNEIKVHKYFLKEFPDYQDVIIDRLFRKIEKHEEKEVEYNKKIQDIFSTTSYRLGNFILRPIAKFIKK